MNKVFRNIGLVATLGIVAVSCTKNEDSPGVEYMPDMYRSPAIEAYVDYGEIRNVERPEFKEVLSSRKPPVGTVPFHSDPEKARINLPLPWKAPFQSDVTHGLFGWEMYESKEEMDAALNGIIKNYVNPITATEDVIASGKKLYMRMCSHCHGEKGDGKGHLAESGKVPGVPSLQNPPNSMGSDGLMYYYMTYGKGIMGAHGMLLTREERWQIVHQLRRFQNKDYPNVVVSDTAITTDSVTVEG